jgi:hypothetical protein
MPQPFYQYILLCQGEKAKSVGHEVLLFCPEGFETAVAPEDKATLAFLSRRPFLPSSIYLSK